MMQNDELELSDPVRSEAGRVEWSIRTEKDGRGVVTNVGVDPDAAREWALKLLTAAGPNVDEIVETWIAGEVRVTIEAPKGCEVVLAPSLFVKPVDRGSFERVLSACGGVTEFEEPALDTPELFSHRDALGGQGGRMRLWLRLPDEMVDRLPKPAIGTMVKLGEERREALAQVKDEQAAADRVAGDHAKRVAIVELLRRVGEPCTAYKIGTLLDPSIQGGEVDELAAPMLADAVLGVASSGPEGAYLYSLGPNADRLLPTRTVVDDPLGPGPGKDGHGE